MNYHRSLRAVERLLEIMATLRSPGGCPWDAAQSPETLQRFIMEETYEVLEALDHGSPEAVCDELGDLLLQIVFQARIFEEQGKFDFADVAEAISAKMVRRHPHVFAGEQKADQTTLALQWERIKAEEKREKGASDGESSPAEIPLALPALTRARKIAEKAIRNGVLAPEPATTVASVRLQMEKLEEEITRPGTTVDSDREEMIGDLLFALVACSDLIGVDAEAALRKSTTRFTKSTEQNASTETSGRERQRAANPDCE